MFRRHRGMLPIIGVVLALVAAERLFFNHPFRRRSTFSTIVYALIAIAIGHAASSAWKRRGQPSVW